MADSFLCMKERADRATCRSHLLQKDKSTLKGKCTHAHTHTRWCVVLNYLWGPRNSSTVSWIICSSWFSHALVHTLFSVRSQVATTFISAGGLIWTSSHTPVQVTPAFHFSRWSVSNATDGWSLNTQTESSSYLPQKGPKERERERERDRDASNVALRCLLLHVLECLTLTFFPFYPYVTHTFSPPTPTAWRAMLITMSFKLSFPPYEGNYICFACWVKMTGKIKRRGQIRKDKKSLSVCEINRQANYSKADKVTISCQMWENIAHLALVLSARLSRSQTCIHTLHRLSSKIRKISDSLTSLQWTNTDAL